MSEPGSTGGPSAILWDMDGTLLDSEKLWDVSLEALAEQLGGTLSAEGRESMVGSNMAHSLTILFDDLGIPCTPEDLATARKWLRAKTAELFDAGLEWRPGAREALELVGRSGLPMALVTNTERFLTERALGTLGRDRFGAIVCGDEVQLGKPHPEPYQKAAEMLGLRPAECLAIEDSPTGTAAAEAAGTTVLVIPCAVPVPAGPRRIQRDSLEGLTLDELRSIWMPS
ncbi:HAD family hydrolase [Lolliginicoccus levis]|uniref:HAD family hydrolase n=1 Tax=Lolliginicoccus levis TaxID=2919542 RepID=UPI00241E8960|nr:HAD family phosphatase [Lolliginicoccus levis]